MLSEQLRRFIQTNVRTIWALEVLLLLCRNQGRLWSPDELNRELRGSVGLVRDVLSGFQHAGLVKRDAEDRFQWAPSTAELRQLSQDLVSIYSTRPFSVIKAITEAQTERIQTLADAFKIKKD
ncbi:MAG: hypothetical protein HC869_15890 [Rhodospirillales bacterium]|nr:hypothetical protein [Rhodospirillales bacterium]